MDVCLRGREAVENPGRRGGRIDLNTPAFGRKCIERGSELLGWHDSYPVAEMPLQTRT